MSSKYLAADGPETVVLQALFSTEIDIRGEVGSNLSPNQNELMCLRPSPVALFAFVVVPNDDYCLVICADSVSLSELLSSTSNRSERELVWS